VEYITEIRGHYFFQNPVKILGTQSMIRDRQKPEANIFCYVLHEL